MTEWMENSIRKISCGIFHEKMIYLEIKIVCLETVLGQRSDQQCFVRGSYGLYTIPFIQNNCKNLQQLSRQNSLVKISRRGVYLEIIWPIREYLCNPQCFASGLHGLLTAPFLSYMGKIMHLEGIGWSADPSCAQAQDPALSSIRSQIWQKKHWNPSWHSFFWFLFIFFFQILNL